MFILIAALAFLTAILYYVHRTLSGAEIPINFFHPEKNLIDKIISQIVFKAFFCGDIALFSSKTKDVSNHGNLQLFRDKMENMDATSLAQACKGWKALLPKLNDEGNLNATDEIIGGKLIVKEDQDIFNKWGIKGADTTLIQKTYADVTVEMTCPESAIRESLKQEYNDFKKDGLKRFATCSLQDINPSSDDIPILIWFHGGGMTVGHARESLSMQYVQSLVKSPDGNNAQPLILLSVEYRLAPEHPFPCAIIDILTAVSSMMEQFPRSPIHISGISAGGNLSSVAGLEAHRVYPGRVKSITILQPMLRPEANTASYRRNSRSSSLCPVNFLYWCWSAYLQLQEESDHDESSLTNYNSYKKILESSKWYNDSTKLRESDLWRLSCPQTDIPSGLDSKNAPKIIIQTSKADPLHDDALMFSKAIEDMGGNVSFFDSNGSHVISLMVYSKVKERVMSAWRNAIWGLSAEKEKNN